MILIVGCGFLGTHLIRALQNNTKEPILATVLHEPQEARFPAAEWRRTDVTVRQDLAALADRCRGENLTVFYFSACHNIDFVYTHPEDALRVNLDGLSAFLDCMPRIDRLFFASTDCVYGENTADEPLFDEQAPLRPVNVYGEQKRRAEIIVRDAGFTAVRFGYMLGASLTEKPHFYDKIRAELRQGKTVEMIDGMARSVLSFRQTADLLAALAALPKASLPQTLNVCGDEGLTKYEMGLRLADAFGADRRLIGKISEADGGKFFKDARASRSVMDNRKLKTLLGLDSILWQPAL